MTLHHIEDAAAALAAMRAVLRPGGVVVIADLEAQFFADDDPEAVVKGVHHRHGFSRDQISALFAAAGLALAVSETPFSIELWRERGTMPVRCSYGVAA